MEELEEWEALLSNLGDEAVESLRALGEVLELLDASWRHMSSMT